VGVFWAGRVDDDAGAGGGLERDPGLRRARTLNAPARVGPAPHQDGVAGHDLFDGVLDGAPGKSLTAVVVVPVERDVVSDALECRGQRCWRGGSRDM
jgi:hypothetical protein